jgi:O-acetyl-ADP-ribose deacetylase (regulator of RNase III)
MEYGTFFRYIPFMSGKTCDRCGKPGATRMGGRSLCQTCYFEVNSCCAHEFEPVPGTDVSAPKVVEGDLTQLRVDAIVNAANPTLMGGGGVDGAIHRAAGPALAARCATLGGCETGDAKLTPGYNLPARYVLHTVGPVWHGGGKGEPELLASCYRRCLETAAGREDIRSIAFPCISTGVYGFPKDLAADIATRTVREILATLETPPQVIFCCFSAGDAERYRQRLG